MKPLNLHQLERKANLIRQDIIKMLTIAGSGHSAGSLGMADVFTVLYFSGLVKHHPQNPNWEDRDRIILSHGHICPVRYAAMAHAGYFPLKELSTLRQLGSRLQGHPEALRLPGLETTSGPLGSGLAQAAGIAYAARMDQKTFRVYCLCSDGEHDEGNHWEAVMFAGKNQLSNLTLIIDRNNIQIDGHTEDVMPLEPLDAKYAAFNWRVLHINGHNHEEIIDALTHAQSTYETPTAIIAHTIPGKGVSFMENDPAWHGRAPDSKQARQALRELKSESHHFPLHQSC